MLKALRVSAYRQKIMRVCLMRANGRILSTDLHWFRWGKVRYDYLKAEHLRRYHRAMSNECNDAMWVMEIIYHSPSKEV
jgi:hypothetical protein